MVIFLIGYMGSGKSTLGPLLATALHSNFVDLDSYIEQQYQKTIPTIFKTEGEARFRELEHTYLKRLIQAKNTVIAVGGGTPCFNENMELMTKNGVTIYLKAGITELIRRLNASARSQRPLISNLTDAQLTDFIKRQLTKREPFYQRAKHTIETSNKSVAELVIELQSQLQLK